MDYRSLGLRIGLEIHQQLDTKKLFCSCPSLLRDDPPDFTVTRKLRAVAGEEGKIDIAAQAEQLRGRTFVYEGYNDTTCLVELDEEPPHPINQEALLVALQITHVVHATTAAEIQVMRKTIVNGSVVSGFQRTALIGIDGHIDGPFGTISIPTILLEEDAAKDVAQEEDNVVYRLDRQGIPLIEISTGPDITEPKQCMDVAAYLGMLLRSTEKVKRGLGTIRQDLNVSITGGQRVEIKGAQELKLLPLLVEYEAQRQKNLLLLAEKYKKIIIHPVTEVTSFFRDTSSKLIAETLQKGGIVLAIALGEMKGFLGLEIQPGRRVGTELSDYAKVHGGVGGLFHSDELPRYGISQEEVEKIRAKLCCGDTDAFILIADRKERAEKAMHAVIARIQDLPNGVLKEVRRANPDGTTSYLRPMPSAARLYPETDVRPVVLHYTEIPLPELWTEKIKRLEALGLSHDLAQILVSDGHAAFLLDCIKKYPLLKPSFVAESIVALPKQLQRKYNLQIHPTAEEFHAVFTALSAGKITKEALLDIFRGKGSLHERISSFSLLSDKELEKKIEEIVAQLPDVSLKVLSGQVIDALKTRADVQKIVQILQKIKKYK